MTDDPGFRPETHSTVESQTCPCCGGPVVLVSGDEGTNHFEPTFRKRISALEADLAVTQGHLRSEVRLHRATEAELEKVRGELAALGPEAKLKIGAYDRARAKVKITGDTRAEWVMRAEKAEADYAALETQLAQYVDADYPKMLAECEAELEKVRGERGAGDFLITKAGAFGREGVEKLVADYAALLSVAEELAGAMRLTLGDVYDRADLAEEDHERAVDALAAFEKFKERGDGSIKERIPTQQG